MPSGAGRHARALWHAAFAMGRRMIRPGTRHGTGGLFAYYLAAAHRRFGDAAMPVVRAAGGCALARLHIHRAATGTVAELDRQGMLTRCVRLEKAPRGGWSWAWTHDPLAAVNLNRSYRVHLARQRHEVARAMAEDRLAMILASAQPEAVR